MSSNITLVGKDKTFFFFFFFGLPVRIQGDSYSFVIAESEYDNQIAPSPTNVKEKGIKLKNIYIFVIKM